jgi:DMSO/TMAO reductase YedYZ molybdopterin-dependent catalytic subunit
VRRVSNRFLYSFLAGSVALLVSYVGRLWLDSAFIPELASQTFFAYVPTWLESSATESLGVLAKYTTFVVAIILTLGVYVILGYYLLSRFDRLGAKSPLGRTLVGGLFSYIVLLLLGSLLLLLTPVTSVPLTFTSLAVGLLTPQLAFGFVLSYLYSQTERSEHKKEPTLSEEPKDIRRRFYIKAGVGAAVALGLLLAGVDLFLPKTKPVSELNNEVQTFFMNEVMSNPEFYRVDINIEAPKVDVSSWRLPVTGLVANPLNLTYGELTSMPSVEQYNTLQCISNNVGGDLISNAKWRGVRLQDMLRLAAVSQSAVYVVFKCYDGYDVGIPIERALQAGTILAYQMNDAPLPPEHGFPIRAIVPGLYGQHNAKWITAIEVVGEVYQGFWQRRGWANDATYNTVSTIVIPGSSPLRSRFILPSTDNAVQEGVIPVAGIAFSGDRGIAKVEVSTDGGNTWQQASLKDPLSNYTWVLWKLDWNPTSTGSYRLVVRATDGEGNIQISTISGPFPSGATGYHVVDVDVVA